MNTLNPQAGGSLSSIRPKTYNEALRLSRCYNIRKYAPDITEQQLVDIYNFISENPQNKVGISNSTVYFVNAAGEKTEAYTVNTAEGFDQLVIGYAFFKVVNTATSSGCGGCGCSSNNNNNNNNNNNG